MVWTWADHIVAFPTTLVLPFSATTRSCFWVVIRTTRENPKSHFFVCAADRAQSAVLSTS